MPDGKIIFNNYKPNKRTINRKDVTVGVFLDGTTNNRTNIAIYRALQKKKSGAKLSQEEEDLASRYPSYRWDMDSYNANDESNIARMEPCYLKNKDTYSVYIEGPGTEDGDSDTIKGYAYGSGATGVKAKVLKAIDQLLIKSINIDEEINLTLDVYGFSRGAAAARHFIYIMTRSNLKYNKPKPGLELKRIGPAILDLNYLSFKLQIQEKRINALTIRFVGLYDTVSSYSESITPLPNFDNDVSELHIDCLGHSKVQSVVQLAAADEIRENFSLTNINSAGDKGFQVFLPGVHSDIGGSYLNKQLEKRIYNSENEIYMRQLVDEGWYTLSNTAPQEGLYRIMSSSVNGNLYEGKRTIDNRYSHIPLHLMCKLAEQKNSKFDFVILQTRYTIPEQSNHILRYIYNQLEQYVEAVQEGKADNKRESYKEFISIENLRILRRGFLHISVNYDKTGYGAKSSNKRSFING